MQAVAQSKYYTPEKYLELEEKAEYKSEYRDGEIVPMTGETTNHNEIVGNFYAYFKFALREKGYRIFMGDVRLWIPMYRQYTYPDLLVIQGRPVYEGKGTTTVTNPCLIVEVLSKSTRDYDRSQKFEFYRSIPEFREYILVDQYKYHVEQFVKQEEGYWIFREYDGEDACLSLGSIEFEIAFCDLYAGVEFEGSL